MPTPANPNLLQVDWSKIPAPTDDGGAKHLAGMQVPDVPLAATDGTQVSLGKPAGRVVVDDGARNVLQKKGKSLLPSGVVGVEGRFERGACVRICSTDGSEFARGLSDYSSGEIARLAGHKSSEIEELLGYRYADVIIHRDNLVVIS